jgi:hypothetical protein
MRHLLPLLLRWREGPPVDVCCSSPKPAAHWRTVTVDPVVCIGRYEGTDTFLGRREHMDRSLPSSLARREHLPTCVVPPRVRCTSRRKSRQDRWPSDNCAKITRRKQGKNPLSGGVSPLTTGDLIRVRHSLGQRWVVSLRLTLVFGRATRLQLLAQRGCDRSCVQDGWVSPCAAEPPRLYRYLGCTTANGHVLRA